jgi:hypothetical protein
MPTSTPCGHSIDANLPDPLQVRQDDPALNNTFPPIPARHLQTLRFGLTLRLDALCQCTPRRRVLNNWAQAERQHGSRANDPRHLIVGRRLSPSIEVMPQQREAATQRTIWLHVPDRYAHNSLSIPTRRHFHHLHCGEVKLACHCSEASTTGSGRTATQATQTPNISPSRPPPPEFCRTRRLARSKNERFPRESSPFVLKSHRYFDRNAVLRQRRLAICCTPPGTLL